MSNVTETIAQQVATMHASRADQPMDDAMRAWAAEQAQLEAAGVPPTVAIPGSIFPDGDLLDVDGNPTTLTGERAARPAVVVFYRGDWCPYCNLTLRTYQQQLLPVLSEREIALIAISPQKPDGSLSIQEKNDLTFTVLSDPGNQIASQLGILNPERSEAVRNAAASYGLDVAGGNADGTDALPMPTTAIVDANGTLRWIDVHPNYTTRSEPETILAAIKATIDR